MPRVTGSESNNVSNFDIKCETLDDLNRTATQENILQSISSPRLGGALTTRRNLPGNQFEALSARSKNTPRQTSAKRFTEFSSTNRLRHPTKYTSNKENLRRHEELPTDRSFYEAKRGLSSTKQSPNQVKTVLKAELSIMEESTENGKEKLKNSAMVNESGADDRGDGDLETSRLKLSDLNTTIGGMKKTFEEKYREMEDKLKHSDLAVERMALERDKLNLELDRLILELKQTKMELALSEERKEEVELALKNEIKYLINKILQAKGANIQLSPNELSLFVKGNLNKSVQENSSFMNNSLFLNQSYYGDLNSQNRSQVHSSMEQSSIILQNKLDKKTTPEYKPFDASKSGRKSIGKKYISQFRSSPLESPENVNEFVSNESSVQQNILNTSTSQPKKLIYEFSCK